MAGLKVLVWWSRENKVGIESISNVPQNSRFVGAVGPVMFSGDKKFYPAKVVMISDDTNTLDKKLEEMEETIEREKAKAAAVDDAPRARRKNAGRSRGKVGAASDRDVASAVGSKPPVPKHLEADHCAVNKGRKEAQAGLSKVQLSADKSTLSKVRQNLFLQSGCAKSDQSSTSHGPEDNIVSSDDGVSQDEDDEEAEKESGTVRDGKWCNAGCDPCKVLQKYDSPMYQSFLRDMSILFNGTKSQVKFLELLPIKDEVKRVELAPNTEVFMAQSDKDQLKVDYCNKPGTLARETLFVLYGRETFQTVSVTGRGNKDGTYTIPDNVKKAVTGFVNRYVSSDNKLSTRKLVALINKRAPEWRKHQSPQQKSKMYRKSAKKSPKLKSTSPFKVTITPTKERPKALHSPLPRDDSRGVKSVSSALQKTTPNKERRNALHSPLPLEECHGVKSVSCALPNTTHRDNVQSLCETQSPTPQLPVNWGTDDYSSSHSSAWNYDQRPQWSGYDYSSDMFPSLSAPNQQSYPSAPTHFNYNTHGSHFL